MSFMANQSQSQKKKTVPLIYRLQRLFFAACIVLGVVATLVVVVTSPQYYSLQSGTAVMVTTFASASAVTLQVHLLSGVFAVYLLPLSLLAMAWLAMRRSPWLASIGALVVIIGIFPVAAYSAQDALTSDLAHMGSNPLFVTIAQQFNDDGVMSYYKGLFALGTVLGPTLIGIALWRARAVPIWAAVLITFGRLLVILSFFVLSLPSIYIEFLSWVPLFIGSFPAALAMVKAPYNESQLVEVKGAQALSSK